MNSSDSASDEPAPDPYLRDELRSLPIPGTPADLESRVRRRLRQRRVTRVALGSGAALALVVALFAWRPWAEVEAPVASQPQPAPPIAQVAPAPAREIPTDDLAVLFAPPPVDSLAIVGGRNEKWVATLNRLEDVK